MLSSRLPSILPRLSNAQAVEVASIYSLAGIPRKLGLMMQAPFRSPHHTASSVSLVGGGAQPKPGEISLSHYGVLFLDELPEYARSVLEVLREPIESGEIRISRASASLTFPADFQLIAAMNPCPCGYSGHPTVSCTDTPQQISNYRRKLSGPLLDRFDLHVEVASQPASVLLGKAQASESSNEVLARVSKARDAQITRQGKLNSALEGGEIAEHCAMQDDMRTFLESAMDRMALSARAAHRILKVARTLADLQESESIQMLHLSEALAYRGLDRKSGS